MTPLQHRVFGMVRDILAACGSASSRQCASRKLAVVARSEASARSAASTSGETSAAVNRSYSSIGRVTCAHGTSSNGCSRNRSPDARSP
jgi:hypothetical protein